MFEGNSLSAHYHLRDVEHQFKRDRRQADTTRPDHRPALRFDQIPTSSGVAALLLVAITFGSMFWMA